TLVSAGIDAVVWGQIHGDVEREAMEAAAAADAQAERHDLGVADVHARGAVAARRLDAPAGQRVDGGLFDAAHELAHADPQPPQVQQRIRDQLARAVVGDLPAAVHRNDGNPAWRQDVLPLAGLAER